MRRGPGGDARAARTASPGGGFREVLPRAGHPDGRRTSANGRKKGGAAALGGSGAAASGTGREWADKHRDQQPIFFSADCAKRHLVREQQDPRPSRNAIPGLAGGARHGSGSSSAEGSKQKPRPPGAQPPR